MKALLSLSSWPTFLALAILLVSSLHGGPLLLREGASGENIAVYREGETRPFLTHNLAEAFRPYIHPMVAPDGKGTLTEFSPSHHPHQTGLYWGLTRLNGRDFFHNPTGSHWRKASSDIIEREGESVRWETAYHLLEEGGRPIMRETQRWELREAEDRYLLDLTWTGVALTDLVIGEHDYGGLFLRMPWKEGIDGAVVNSSRRRGRAANGQRAIWVDVGMEVEGRDDHAHIAILDHPDNDGYPTAWRVDGNMGVGPSRAIQGNWQIAEGEQATFRHRLVVYTGPLDDVGLHETWSAYSGRRYGAAEWWLAREEAQEAEFLEPKQAAEKMTAAEGMEVKVFAAEPDIAQPIAFCWDDRGRMWVTENRDYESRGAGFSAHGGNRILILEDLDGDGTADSQKVFLDDIPFPSAIAWGMGGLWLGAPPNLLFVSDRDRDDRPDGEIEVRLTGWGIRDRHEVMNSLRWGPDGWLYGCQGFATPSHVGQPIDARGLVVGRGDEFPDTLPVKNGVTFDGGVWRYHPTQDRFEVVAHGFSNPWGLDFNERGQMFITACVIPHLWHVIPGGFYHRQGGSHVHAHVYEDIKTIADHRHRSAHGGARVYLADAFPEEYHGQILMANIHERSLLADVLTPQGSGYVGSHGGELLQANDPQWIGFSVEIGPAGEVYALDWHDADICGNSVQNKETGRIFRLAPKGLKNRVGLDLAAMSDGELAEQQLSRNAWFSRRAQLLLQERAAVEPLDETTLERLREMLGEKDEIGLTLRALWTLHVTGGMDEDRLFGLLGHPSADVRGWAVRLLCEDGEPAARVMGRFAEMARKDPSPVVRLALASALQRISTEARWEMAEGLLTRAEDADDHNLPKMIWFGLEPLVSENPTRFMALAHRSEMPLVSRFIARRGAAARHLDELVALLEEPADENTTAALLQGMLEGVAGLSKAEASLPRGWSELEGRLLAEGPPEVRKLILRIGQTLGSARAAEIQLALLRDGGASLDERRKALQSLAENAYEPAMSTLLELLDDPHLRRESLRGLSEFDDPRIAEEILWRYSQWPDMDRLEAIQTLASRPATARVLDEALRAGRVPLSDVPAFVARSMQQMLQTDVFDSRLRAAASSGGKASLEARLRSMLSDDYVAAGDLSHGRAVFQQNCAACHRMYGAGGNIGPDLTGSNRANLDYILREILYPNEFIQEGYQLNTVTLADGRVLAGTLVRENHRQLTLRLVGKDTTIAKSHIVEREKSELSMMPEGLLRPLSDEDIRDLIGYLRTTRQVPLEGEARD